jgi:hypothetical protein
MSIHPARVVASLSLLAGGSVVGVAILAIALAKALVAAGATIRPADAALLDDLVPLLPFIAGFAIASIVAGVGLLVGQARAETLAMGTSIVAVTVGVIGLSLIFVGRDPLASTVRATTTADGIGIVGTFTLIYLAVIVALGAARMRVTRSSRAAVAS